MNAEQSSSSTDIPDNTVSVESKEAVIVSEMEEKRSADTKTYLLSDGSYLHAIYPEQVHYRENNEWVDVDNGFEATNDDDGDEVLENKKNNFKIKFSNKAKNKKLVSLKSGEHQISWALKDADKVLAKVVELDSSNSVKASLENINSGVVYEDILPSVNLQYIIDASSINHVESLKQNSN